ncbi:MAG: FimV/HubP family polar landmark protein, partial [Thiothrix sp.]
GAARSEPVEDANLLDFGLDADARTPEAAPTTESVEEPTPVLAASPATNLNLHLDNNTGIKRILPKDTFYAPISDADKDWLGDIDDALSFLDFPDEEIDLHEAHISTKLDLARAYLDMGDIEGARSTLEEVMVEGNDEQRREAEVLLHQTG